MTVTFVVPGIPVAQPRQRHCVINGIARNYTPKKDPVNAYKEAIRLYAKRAIDGPPLDGPISILITCVFPRPKNRTWKSKPMPREPKTSTPDCDNLAKSVKDALTGVGYRDDALVWNEHVIKLIAAGHEQPHTVITLEYDTST